MRRRFKTGFGQIFIVSLHNAYYTVFFSLKIWHFGGRSVPVPDKMVNTYDPNGDRILPETEIIISDLLLQGQDDCYGRANIGNQNRNEQTNKPFEITVLAVVHTGQAV